MKPNSQPGTGNPQPGTHNLKSSSQTPESQIPLCVDLDGTLVYTDTLWESLLKLVRERPWCIPLLPFRLLWGKAAFKDSVARRVEIDPAALCYNQDLINFLKCEKENGRRIVLVTGANEKIAVGVADHLRIFDQVFASNRESNLVGDSKVSILVEQFGERDFDYVGNDWSDLPVFLAARKSIFVNAPKRLRARFSSESESATFSTRERLTPGESLRAVRLHHWSKNLLLFVPLLTSHQFGDPAKWVSAIIGFVAFGFCASSVYLVNDLLDLESDRLHPTKRNRSIASGRLSIPKSAAISLGLFAASILLSLSIPRGFLVCLLIYWLATNAYSLALKQLVLVDVFVLAGLYVMRIFAGAEVVEVSVSPWLIGFSLFFFLSLAFVKRYVELIKSNFTGFGSVPGRGYQSDDHRLIAAVGIVCGCLSTLVLALYVNSAHVASLYGFPRFIWIAVPLMLYWINRIWLLSYRGQLHEDPVLFALKDRVTYVVLGMLLAVFLVASSIGFFE